MRNWLRYAAAAGAVLVAPTLLGADLPNRPTTQLALAAPTPPPWAPSVDGSLPEPIPLDTLETEVVPTTEPPVLYTAGPVASAPDAGFGIPASALAAYQRAERTLGTGLPGCHAPWSLLAAIGKVESGHARGGLVDAEGNTAQPILGPVLNGGDFAAIPDTDGGLFDGDTVWDRAVGPMQFIPSTWRHYAADGNGDGVLSPHNIHDAVLAAGRYLCAGGTDLSDRQQRAAAVFRYNHSQTYVRTVLSWADTYARGVTPEPDSTDGGGWVVAAGAAAPQHAPDDAPAPTGQRPAGPAAPGKAPGGTPPASPEPSSPPSPTSSVPAPPSSTPPPTSSTSAPPSSEPPPTSPEPTPTSPEPTTPEPTPPSSEPPADTDTSTPAEPAPSSPQPTDLPAGGAAVPV
ncbi:lytic murein transglycosylase [Saccharomonospora sp. NPDC046836]|uniref:lytic transglycosylase domain-containing protein n=1 Tax=Saccharomonospora sp. NPDC046836 TaxID=3156921 RepID=UPI0033D1E0EE